MQNHLTNQTSPYLLQHAQNPVDWYPWGEEAFERASREDKPIFLSIGYSTCHWCHVMAHESFEDSEVAELLNQHFISIKVDKEERPDIDSIYMSVCQAFTGNGGWPMTIIMTPQQKPFFAGTYFPKHERYGQFGLISLLNAVVEKWQADRAGLLHVGDEIVSILNQKTQVSTTFDTKIIEDAIEIYEQTFDKEFGGFGRPPKFPTPHNLLFLMQHYEKTKDAKSLEMSEKTLLQMYRGGIFDHIGGGFCRYSTDRYFLVPHFEKMLYDNALLILAYCKAYELTKKQIYREIAKKTATYILREMTSEQGGFYSAQDADSEGVEGKYYLFEPSEIVEILGEQKGREFNEYFDITQQGNFEGKNIPNLLKNQNISQELTAISDTDLHENSNKNLNNNNEKKALQAIYEYRKNRCKLHLDDKILTSWNGLMIMAFCHLYRVTLDETYLNAAVKAQEFVQNKLCEKDQLYVSYRDGKRGQKGFLDDYANEILALLALYEATLKKSYLQQARTFCKHVMEDFYDEAHGGFFLYGKANEQLIMRPKETYDGAMFSGNSAMAYILVRLSALMEENQFEDLAKRQLSFMSTEAKHYPAGYAMFLMALSDFSDNPTSITIVVKEEKDLQNLPCKIPLNAIVRILEQPTDEYPLKNDKTTFYVCQDRACQPPVNELSTIKSR